MQQRYKQYGSEELPCWEDVYAAYLGLIGSASFGARVCGDDGAAVVVWLRWSGEGCDDGGSDDHWWHESESNVPVLARAVPDDRWSASGWNADGQAASARRGRRSDDGNGWRRPVVVARAVANAENATGTKIKKKFKKKKTKRSVAKTPCGQRRFVVVGFAQRRKRYPHTPITTRTIIKMAGRRGGVRGPAAAARANDTDCTMDGMQAAFYSACTIRFGHRTSIPCAANIVERIIMFLWFGPYFRAIPVPKCALRW